MKAFAISDGLAHRQPLVRWAGARAGPGHPGTNDQVRTPQQHRSSGQHGRESVRELGRSEERREDEVQGFPSSTLWK